MDCASHEASTSAMTCTFPTILHSIHRRELHCCDSRADLARRKSGFKSSHLHSLKGAEREFRLNLQTLALSGDCVEAVQPSEPGCRRSHDMSGSSEQQQQAFASLPPTARPLAVIFDGSIGA